MKHGNEYSAEEAGNGNSFSLLEECDLICAKFISSPNEKGIKLYLIYKRYKTHWQYLYMDDALYS